MVKKRDMPHSVSHVHERFNQPNKLSSHLRLPSVARQFNNKPYFEFETITMCPFQVIHRRLNLQ